MTDGFLANNGCDGRWKIQLKVWFLGCGVAPQHSNFGLKSSTETTRQHALIIFLFSLRKKLIILIRLQGQVQDCCHHTSIVCCAATFYCTNHSSQQNRLQSLGIKGSKKKCKKERQLKLIIIDLQCTVHILDLARSRSTTHRSSFSVSDTLAPACDTAQSTRTLGGRRIAKKVLG